MRRIVFLLVGLVLAGAIAVTVMDSGKAPPPEHGGTTADRLSNDRMAKMVEGPIKLVEKKDMAGASRLFEADLAKASAKGGMHAADLLTAYGIELRRSEHKRESIPYLRRAIDAYRTAAPGRPELALALSNYGHALLLDNPDNPPPDVLSALREALQLREKTLGRGNAETAVNYVQLGRAEGLPVFSGRDPAKVAQAAEKIRTGIRLLPDAPNGDPNDLQDARLQLALLYARNGDTPAAFKAAGDYLATNPGFGAYRLRQVAVVFEKAGDTATGRRLRDTYGIPDESTDDEDTATPTIKNAGKLTQD